DQQLSDRDRSKSKLDQAPRTQHSNHGGMKVTIVDRKPTTVAYLRHVGPYGKPSPTSGCTRQLPGWRPTDYTDGLVTASAMTTPASPRPRSSVTTPQSRCERACWRRRLPENRDLRWQVRRREIQRHRRRGGEAWAWLLGDWLPGSGMQL